MKLITVARSAIYGDYSRGKPVVFGKTKPHWAPKISQAKIQRLYESDARGIIDLSFIDEVVWALWERCDSILTVTAAHYGHVLCPACDTVIKRQNPWSANEIVKCATCGWQIPWAMYHQSYRGKQLFAANAVEIFETYHKDFPRAGTAQDKMILIDGLIHAFHVSLKGIGRPVAANLMEGSLKDVIHFLDKLASGEASAAGIGNSRAAWKQTLAAADWTGPFIEDNADPEEISHT
jgi:hypothetical protein